MPTQEKFMESLSNAERSLQVADHLTYITFPLVKEKRLLLKVLAEINLSLINAINAALQYEYYYKRIQIYKDARENFNTFQHISWRYGIEPEQLKKIVDIIKLAEKHTKSPFEFVKEDKIVIMSEGMHTDTLDLDKIKLFLQETKDILKKISQKIKV